MTRTLFAAFAAFALAAAAPARADEGGCKNCPHHAQMASADDKGGEKKDADKMAKCACAGADSKECKCGAKCECPHCHSAKAAKKGEEKKT